MIVFQMMNLLAFEELLLNHPYVVLSSIEIVSAPYVCNGENAHSISFLPRCSA